MTLKRLDIPAVIVILGLLPVYFAGNSYLEDIFTLVLVFSMFTIGLNIIFGHTDQLFLFSGALAGIGAYSGVIISVDFGTPVIVAVLIGATLAGLVGALVSYVSSRLEMTIVVVSILTMSLQFAFSTTFSGAKFTGGTSGRMWPGMELGAIYDLLPFTAEVSFYYLMVAILAVTLVLYRYLINSTYGRAFEAIRQDRLAADSIGIDVVKYHVIAGFIGAFIIGLGGALYAEESTLFVLPSMFTFIAVDAQILIMLVLGGRRTAVGPIFGAFTIILLEQWLQQFENLHLIIFGALLIVLFVYLPDGLVPPIKNVISKIRTKVQP